MKQVQRHLALLIRSILAIVFWGPAVQPKLYAWQDSELLGSTLLRG